jgi:hypothetical protein
MVDSASTGDRLVDSRKQARSICKKLSVPSVNEHYYRDSIGFQNKREALLAPHAAQVVTKTKMWQRMVGRCFQHDEFFYKIMFVSTIAQKCHKSLNGVTDAKHFLKRENCSSAAQFGPTKTVGQVFKLQLGSLCLELLPSSSLSFSSPLFPLLSLFPFFFLLLLRHIYVGITLRGNLVVNMEL